jgi:hypothetical protein
VSVVCCQVEVSATSWSRVQRSPTDCGGSEMCVAVKPRRNEEAQAHIRLSSEREREREREILLLVFCLRSVWKYVTNPSFRKSLAVLLLLFSITELLSGRRFVNDQNISFLLFVMSITGVETLQVELLKTLLDSSDGTPTQASSRTIFLHKFCNFLHEDILSNRVSYY